MPRISPDAAAALAHANLTAANRRLQESMERLTTGVRINRASDDPGGLVTAENFRTEADALTPAIEQAQRAGNLTATADAALAEVANLLLNIQQLVIESANTGALNREQLAANQLQVDAAIDSIRSLAGSTSFAGRKLLDGSLAYATSGVTADLADLSVARALLGTRDYLPVRVDVTASAQPARLDFQTSQTTETVHLRIAGSRGAESVALASGATADTILLAANQVADITGVSASLINSANPASGVQFVSSDVGSAAFVSVEPLEGSFALAGGAGSNRAVGQDVAGTINGHAARGAGRTLSLFSSDLELDLRLADGFATGTTSFVITGGGALFQLGPTATEADQAAIGVPSIGPDALGGSDIGFLDELATGGSLALVAGHAGTADDVVVRAIGQVASLRGRLGAFSRHTLSARSESMTTRLQNVLASESAIRDTDYAAEISEMTRQQLLSQVAVSIVGASQQSRQTVLQLLA